MPTELAISRTFNLQANNLLTAFFPYFSFVMRMKVLKKLSMVLNEDKIDKSEFVLIKDKPCGQQIVPRKK